ncbi:MAG: DUF5685 family protein [Clostridiales bacterium]|nr:DUF5685 family protein [Clostridiales bacterium]
MFGYVVADQSNLTPEALERYRGVYCGLCRAIGQRHGQLSRLCLTYDMTFLILLLDSLYEPERTAGSNRCPPHPVKPRPWQQSEFTDYAADMNVALAYYNCLDDWQDDHSPSGLAVAQVLKGRYPDIKQRWPRQCDSIENGLERLSALEREKSPDLDAVCRAFGDLMGELFVLREDRWADDLREMGGKLGQFIYLMDAVLDREKDDKKGRYNPITAFETQSQTGPFQELPVLTMLIGDSTLAFERLPLEQDMDLLRNILYSGVWTRYAMEQNRKARKEGRTTHKEEPTT